MSRHTPGPWKADGYVVRQSATGSRVIADVCYTGPHHTPPEEYPKSCRLTDEANARLIAAAPTMLEALQELLIWEPRQKDEGERHAYDLAYEAVRLATRQP